jgi:hypothetical protein
MVDARRRLLVLVLLGLGAAHACRKRVSAEDQVRQAIASAVEGVRERKVKKLAAIVSSQYSDKEGRDRQAVVDLARAQILFRPNLYLVTRISSVVCLEAVRCEAVVLAAMASVPTQDLSGLASSQADVYRFDLDLADEDGSWRVRSASWAPASVKDLL